MEKGEKIILASICDKAEKCWEKNIPANTHFLDLHEQTIAEQQRKSYLCKYVFWGGYPDAERKVLFFLPDYLDAPSEDVLCAVQVKSSANSKLTHRDYLGAALGLGIKRHQLGDILLQADGGYIILLREMADFLAANLLKVGRENVSCSVVELCTINFQPPQPKKTCIISVSSLRLDKIVAEVFKISRKDAAAAILSGKVYVNQKEVPKPDFLLKQEDKITLRGKGKAEFFEINGTSKKGKLRIGLKLY